MTDDQRRRLAIKGKALTRDDRMLCCQVVRPDTILMWFRRLVAQRYDGSKKRKTPCRPRKAKDIRALVLRLATENAGWGLHQDP